MPRRKVCFVLPSLNGGGAERAAVQILNGLDAGRWERSMFLFERTGPYLADLDPAIAVTSADSASRFGRWNKLRAFIAEPFQVSKAFPWKPFVPDLVT